MIEHPLFKSQRVYRFVEEFVACRNGAEAARRAGYSVVAAGAQASTLLSDPKVQALVEARIRELSEEALVTPADVLREWLELAAANPSDVVKMRRCNCRYCWGLNHGFQWEAWSYSEKVAEAIEQNELPPKAEGGMGFAFNREPNPDCPRCGGEGHVELFFADTTTLTGGARKLIAGIKQTKEGIEVKFRDQDAALQNVAKYLGMLVERRELTGANGKPLIPSMTDLPTDPAQLALAYSTYVKGV